MVRLKSSFLAVLVICAAGTVLTGASGGKTMSMPTGDIPGWKQTLAQDFRTQAAPGQVGDTYGYGMRGYSGFLDTSGNGIYSPDSVLSVSGGGLDFFLHTAGGKPRVASVVPFGYDGQTYGRYSIRFRSDPLPGYKIAFMLWPSSGNWNEGEIDWPEGNLNGKMYPASALKGSLNNGAMTFDPPSHVFSPTDSSDWHVATTEWTPGKVKWFWDGALVGETSVPSGVPNTKMRWTLQAETEIGADAVIPTPRTAGHLQVDWVVQYAYSP